jgi:hypothetical protein
MKKLVLAGITTFIMSISMSASPILNQTSYAKDAVLKNVEKNREISASPNSQGDINTTSIVLKAFESSWDADQYVLAFFYSKNDTMTEEQRIVFDAAAAELKDKADAHVVDITDPKQKDVVSKFKVDRAPMPLALVIASNGAVTGGFPQKFSEEDIINSIVGPNTTRCLKALQDSKYVFVCIQSNDAEANANAMKGIKDFKSDIRYSLITEVVTFDETDLDEQRMLNSLGINGKHSEAVTAFLAPPGVLIGKFTGKTNKDQLLAALAQKQQGGGCCPGSSKSCK